MNYFLNFFFRTSTINKFVTDFIKNVFLGQVHFNIQESIEKATKSKFSVVLQ